VRAALGRGRGRPGQDLDLPLPRLPAAHRERVRDAGTLAPRAGADRGRRDRVRISDEGEERSFFFCPRCGATVYYWTDPEQIAVPVAAFADRNFPAPRVSVWEDRMHPWVRLPEGIEHIG
jgi:hypothetical protein